ncbi:MAG: MCP four helix bundle domain-containing protein [Deltaproteobacteria bacterium]|nr:MCP four helix bundle domain-containing protein [Deltaproteobacteria bacterium]
MKNWKIASKLYLSFGLLMLLLLFGGIVTWNNSNNTQNLLTEYADQVGAGILLSNAERGMWELRFGVANFITADEKGQGKIRADGPKWYAQVEDNLKAYDSDKRTPEEKARLKEFEEVFSNYKTARNHWFEIFQSGKKEEAAEYRAQNTNRFGAGSVKTLAQMIEIQKSIGRAREKAGMDEGRRTIHFVIWLTGFSLISGVFLSIFITRMITNRLKKVIAGLREGADQVASAAGQVSSASQSLAEGASEQAAGLEETSSSMEEMSSMTKQNAHNAGQANTLMAETGQVVDEANRSIDRLTGSMNEISQASEETGKIIKTIDEIAFQTNLLALNAAVEAARAGEAGAGFAVVADEVRNLALRAAEAAKNTAGLIEDTVKKVKKGSEIVIRTNEAFLKVAGGSKKTSELVAEIAAASQEQAQGIEQVSKAIAEMDRVVQQNAAGAEESASASEELNAQAEQMKDFVQQLVNLVGGAANENGAAKTKTPGHPLNPGTGRKALAAPLKKVKTPAWTTRTVSPLKEIRPERVIPLEAGDFKEF